VDVLTASPDVFKNSPYVENVLDSVDISKYVTVFDLNDVHERVPGIHMLDSYSNEVFKRADLDVRPELFDTDADKVDINIPYIVMHLRNNNGASRNLPADFYVKVIEQVLNATTLQIVLVGFGADFGIKDQPRVTDKVNQLSLHQTYNVIKNAKCFVGVDSAPVHITSCTETPMVAFFTETKGIYREPRNRKAKHIAIASNIDCYGCLEKYLVPGQPYNCVRGDNECINRFSVDEVVHSILQLVS
jgi:ADP-heptose:LPS heptosyltransferase